LYGRFTPFLGKTTRISAKTVVSKTLRKPIMYSNEDVVSTYKKIVEHWLEFKSTEESSCHPFFFIPKKDFRFKDKVWYTRGPVGRNNLQAYTKLLAKDVPALKGQKITNKTGRGTRITRLNKALVPIEKAMETTGHCSIDAYEKYNQEKKYISKRATQKILSGEIKDGCPLLYSNAYKEELERRDMKVGFVASF
jgi:hypothetical protein